MTTSETERAYLAGILDGEGYISLWMTHKDYLSYRVGITGNSVELHAWIAQRFGGTTRVDRKYDRCIRTRWMIREEIEELLHAVYPYLVIKKRQAEIMLSYFEKKPKNSHGNMTNLEKLKFHEDMLREHARVNDGVATRLENEKREVN